MRLLSSTLGIATLLLLAGGCADTKWAFLRKSPDTARLPEGTPSADQLVAYLNANAQKIQSLECQELDVGCKENGREFGLRGTLVCQKPKNFRMRAHALGNTEADIGSNKDEFWYWIARGDNVLVHCSYKDLPRVSHVPFPFQPEWVMQSLGMAEYSPADYKVVTRGKTWELVRDTVNPQGQRVQDVTVFNIPQSRVQVSDHIVRDEKGNQICAAHISEVQNVGGVIVPRRIVFVYRAQGIELKMKLGDDPREVVINREIGRDLAEGPNGLFTRPVLSGVQSFDLARGTDGATSQIRPAGGYQQ